MPRQCVSDLAPNARVDGVFAVKSKTLSEYKQKPGKFMTLTLADRTGEIAGRIWDGAEEVDARIAAGDVVVVEGRVDEYRGTPQVVVESIAVAEEGSYDLGELVPRSERSTQELELWLQAAVEEVDDPWLRRLLDLFLEDEQFKTRLLNAPGAKSLHHAHVGGLLEHTLSVVHIVRSVCHLYPQMNADLLITGALLHDIGKIEELEGLLAVDYSDEGNFLGHVVLTDRMVCEKLRMIPDFPPHLANLLSHMLLSHHGEREWGAPVVPKTMEACALHYADNMDARLQGFRRVIESGAPNGASWSPYVSSYQRTLYLGPNRVSDEQEGSGGSGQ